MDARFQPFFNRAGRTLSIAVEVYQVLKAPESEQAAKDALKRLELEVATWDKDSKAHKEYKIKHGEYVAFKAVGASPDAPLLPDGMPESIELNYLFETLNNFKRVDSLMSCILAGQSASSAEGVLSDMAHYLGYLATAIECLKGDVERAELAISDMPTPTLNETPLETSEYITTEQMALLAGITADGMNNRLSKSRPGVEPIKPGGRKPNAYPWPQIRSWMLKNWPSRSMPEDFQELQKVMQELSTP